MGSPLEELPVYQESHTWSKEALYTNVIGEREGDVVLCRSQWEDWPSSRHAGEDSLEKGGT